MNLNDEFVGGSEGISGGVDVIIHEVNEKRAAVAASPECNAHGGRKLASVEHLRSGQLPCETGQLRQPMGIRQIVLHSGRIGRPLNGSAADLAMDPLATR